jgi:hypothetical protein
MMMNDSSTPPDAINAINSANSTDALTDATYMGFIQALAWTTGADGNNPTVINEPDQLWLGNSTGGTYIPWDRSRFLTLLADFGDTTMLLKLIDGPAWVIYSTESDDCPDATEWDDMGLAFAAELADNN